MDPNSDLESIQEAEFVMQNGTLYVSPKQL